MSWFLDRFGWTNDPDNTGDPHDETQDRLAEWPTDEFRDDEIPDDWWPFDSG